MTEAASVVPEVEHARAEPTAWQAYAMTWIVTTWAPLPIVLSMDGLAAVAGAAVAAVVCLAVFAQLVLSDTRFRG